MIVRFEKVDATGNTFLLVEAPVAHVDSFRDFARHATDPVRGVGADGVLIVQDDEAGRGRLAIINRDGSVPEMCGNGARAAVAYLARKARVRTVSLLTGVGEIFGSVDGEWVTLDLPRGRRLSALTAEEIPAELTGSLLALPVRVDVGNPHVVVCVADVASFPLGSVAAGLAASFGARGANVHVVTPGQPVRARCHERGVGETLACGTGAVAIAEALWTSEDESPLLIAFRGGELLVRPGGPGRVTMAGEVTFLFSGVFRFGFADDFRSPLDLRGGSHHP